MAKTIDLTPKVTKWVLIISGIIISIGGIKRSLEIDSIDNMGRNHRYHYGINRTAMDSLWNNFI